MKRRSFLRRNKRGALLIEVLITISILSIGLTLVIRSYLSSLRATVYTTEYTTAIMLAENKVSEISQGIFIDGDLNETGFFEAPNDRFEYSLETKRVEGSEETRTLQEVTLRVLWPSGRRTNSITIVTYLTGRER